MEPSSPDTRPPSLNGAEMPDLKHETLMQEEGIVKSTLPVDIRNKIKALNFVIRTFNRIPAQSHRNNIIKKDIEICDLIQDFIEKEAPTEEEFTKKEQETMAKQAKEKKEKDETEAKKKLALSEVEGAKKKKETDDVAAAEATRKKAEEEKKKKAADDDDEDPVSLLTGD